MKKEFRSFEDAKKFVASLKLKNQREWATFCKSDSRSESIPTTPARTYKKEWTSWGDFLGTGFVATKNKKFIPFNDARKFVQQFNLTNSADWKKFCKSGSKIFAG